MTPCAKPQRGHEQQYACLLCASRANLCVCRTTVFAARAAVPPTRLWGCSQLSDQLQHVCKGIHGREGVLSGCDRCTTSPLVRCVVRLCWREALHKPAYQKLYRENRLLDTVKPAVLPPGGTTLGILGPGHGAGNSTKSHNLKTLSGYTLLHKI
jgi:hypothetical protein